MENAILQQAVDRAVTMGPEVLMQGMRLRRPSDVVRAASLSRTINARSLRLGPQISTPNSKPALRKLPGVIEPVSIDEVQAALRELDRRSRS